MKQADEERELTRLLSQEGAALEPSIAALRERGPDATELASLASRLMLQGLPLAASVPPRASATWKKWAMAGGGGAAAVLVWLALVPRSAPRSPAMTTHRAAATESVQSLSKVTPTATPLWHARAAAAPSAAVASSADPESVPAPAAEIPTLPSSPAQRAAAPRDTTSHAEPAGTGAKSPVLPNQRTSNTAQPFPSAAAGPSEIELLRDARLALRQSPATALAITEQHGRLYPQGKLSQERELMAISALVALGRRTAALSRAASFERVFPASPYRKQLGELLQ